MEYEDMTAKQMHQELKSRLCPGGKTYFFLDEVQEIPGWEKAVNSLASDFDADLWTTRLYTAIRKSWRRRIFCIGVPGMT